MLYKICYTYIAEHFIFELHLWNLIFSIVSFCIDFYRCSLKNVKLLYCRKTRSSRDQELGLASFSLLGRDWNKERYWKFTWTSIDAHLYTSSWQGLTFNHQNMDTVTFISTFFITNFKFYIKCTFNNNSNGMIPGSLKWRGSVK